MTAFDDTGGDLPPVILIHGVGLSRHMWTAQVAALRERYRVVTLDMLGHGDSPAPRPGAGLDDYADQVAGLLDDLGIPSATLIGFSMGALVARAFALKHPGRLTGLVFLNGVFDRSEDVRANILARVDEVARSGPSANVDSAIARWFSLSWLTANREYIAELRASMAANDWQGYLTTYGLFATEDNYGADRLDEIAVPVLVATGEYDVGSTPDMARGLAARIVGAKVAIVEGARHMMPVEMPQETNALLLGHLDATISQQINAGVAR